MFGKIYPEHNAEMIEIKKYSNSLIRKVSIGNEHLLILFADGTLFGLGKNNLGQLGKKLTTESNSYSELTKLSVSDRILKDLNVKDYNILDIACGDNFSLLLVQFKGFSRIIRFGIHESDRYKDKIEEIHTNHIEDVEEDMKSVSSKGSDYSAKNDMVRNLNIRYIYAKGNRSLFVTFDNRIYIGQKSFSMIPLQEYVFLCQIEKQIKTISMGSENCIIQDVEGSLYAIGDNTYGELGVEDAKFIDEPTRISFFEPLKKKIKKICSGSRNTFVLLEGGEVYACGDNSEGQSTGLATRYASPQKINFDFEETDPIRNLETGFNHSFLVTKKGKLYSWGSANDDKLGTNETNQYSCFAKHVSRLTGKNIIDFYLGKNVSLITTN
eukprot:CAMPEP_0170518320 /NCGR_PEP_ID=MMETSP0209-20121228/4038_1 /TAXON_ID=665100 ORGANISM="Litonotus pictus, Strain P1" /NCGR_SAMPLE_ID=MMETSP0209 /ASSEMBLY_ACC=CAM_ASM_000301 /LENGTH=381 /DNA_ID=CAMNT_0010803835 /DNA_START=112 /DNA_END=1257 /DNA_ORIENTATION=+